MADNFPLFRRFAIGGDLEVNRIGFGAMRLTGQPRNFGRYPDWEGGKAVLRRAVELGVNFIDTALSYGPRHNEQLVAEALFPYPPGLVIATKGGVDKPALNETRIDGSPQTLSQQVDDALIRLKLEQIDLFQLHRVDPSVQIEESVAAMAAMQRTGKIRHIGLSNVTSSELKRAMTVAPIASIQNRFNQHENGDDALVDFAAANGIAYLPYGPLGGNPMFRGALLSPQAALAWLLTRSPNIIVIPGTTSIQHLEQNLDSFPSRN
jgi:pyridoxine 4-dehydrogenase